MTKEEALAWIKGATYEELLRHWRHAPIGDPIFQMTGLDLGEEFEQEMRKKRGQLIDNAYHLISARVGPAPNGMPESEAEYVND